MRSGNPCYGITILVVLVITLNGCKVGPNYAPPPTTMPTDFVEPSPTATTRPSTSPSSEPSTTQPVAVGDLAHWWQTFADPILDQLTRDAIESNLDLRVATARVREARATRGIVAADWYPSVDVNGSYARTRQSLNSNVSGGASGQRIPGFKRENDLWQAGFDATWEIDVFGGTARAVEAAEADIQASIESRRDTLVSLVAEVGRAYIQLRGAQRQLVITEKNLKSQRDTLDLTEQRFKAGLTSELDVARQRAQVETTASTMPNLQTTIRQSIHELSVLIGKDPGALAALLAPEGALPQAPALPSGLPSELLRRRPDVRMAERNLGAATARIGQATADLFPKFSLTGSFGQQSTSFSHLFDSASNFWSIGPAVSWPIFAGGRIRANIDVQNARQEQALATYEQTVLRSLQDVEDALIAYDREKARWISLAAAVDANRRSVDLSNQLYSRGLIDFLSVLDAERALFLSEDALAISDTTVSTNLVAVYKALGGGWDESMDPPPPKRKIYWP